MAGEKYPVAAIILGAGMSKRMGTAKQLLQLGERSLLEVTITNVLHSGFPRVFGVIGHEAERIQAELEISDERFQWVLNEEYKKGQSTSLFSGLQQALNEEYSSVMIFLGDMPFIKQETIEFVLCSGRAIGSQTEKPFMLQPEYNQIPGHPVYLGNVHEGMFPFLAGDEGAKGLKKSLHFYKRLRVTDPGCVFDIDTPEVYEKAKKINF